MPVKLPVVYMSENVGPPTLPPVTWPVENCGDVIACNAGVLALAPLTLFQLLGKTPFSGMSSDAVCVAPSKLRNTTVCPIGSVMTCDGAAVVAGDAVGAAESLP